MPRAPRARRSRPPPLRLLSPPAPGGWVARVAGALLSALVRAMVERNEARVRRRRDSLAWVADSTRVARERAAAAP